MLVPQISFLFVPNTWHHRRAVAAFFWDINMLLSDIQWLLWIQQVLSECWNYFFFFLSQKFKKKNSLRDEPALSFWELSEILLQDAVCKPLWQGHKSFSSDAADGSSDKLQSEHD